MRGGWRATFTDGLLEYALSAGFTGHRPATLTEHTSEGERSLESSSTSPNDAMIDHVLACLTGEAENLIEPASAIPALELTLQVHKRLNQPQHWNHGGATHTPARAAARRALLVRASGGQGVARSNPVSATKKSR
jgi:hypothetical protein